MVFTPVVNINAFAERNVDRLILNVLSSQGDRQLCLYQVDTLDGSFQYYCMEATCPHSGGPLENGDIEDIGDDIAVICPWHDYAFSLKTGKCDQGFEACIFPCFLKDDIVYIDLKDNRLVNLEGIESGLPASSEVNGLEEPETIASLVKSRTSADLSLSEVAVRILNTADPFEKVASTIEWGKRYIENPCPAGQCNPPDIPPRPKNISVVQPGKDLKRGKGGTVESRIKILHSLANIEIVAIDLAWDIIARFSQHKVAGLNELPAEFFKDFVNVAMDEAKHFSLLNTRLKELGSYFGAHPVHNALWESATQTSKSLLARLAVVHMIHEARGLDVNPATIARFEKAADEESVRILNIIHKDEIHHVAYGHKWFSHLAEHEFPNENKYQLFHRTARKFFRGPLKPPFNEKDRLLAGLEKEWYEPLSIK